MKLLTSYDDITPEAAIIRDRIRAIVQHKSHGLYLHGRPGTSKTHTVRSTLEQLAADYTVNSGHLTPIGLFNLLEEHQDGIIVLDDVSAIFNSPIALQVLLAALGKPQNGSNKRPVTHYTANKPRVFQFGGGIICISNLALEGHHKEVLAALRDRVNVIHFDPSDEQIFDFIFKLGRDGVGGTDPKDAWEVAYFLVTECINRSIRPSIRMYVDKAIKDFQLWASHECETHWEDLIVSELEQTLVELQHEPRDISQKDQIETERRIALDLCLNVSDPAKRVAEWRQRTGKQKAAFYRRFSELKKEGRLPAG